MARRRAAREEAAVAEASAREARDASKQAKRGRARERAAFLAADRPDVDRAALAEAVDRLDAAAAEPEAAAPVGVGEPMAFMAAAAGVGGSNASRWVPIGPSVVRRGQAVGRPRVTGRIRDLAVDGTGQRAYAASAKGGLWYTSNGGSTWDPVGGWVTGQRGAGGMNTMHSCGTVMVAFDPGGNAANDLVTVGTGETTGNGPHETVPVQGGVGVLAARGPAAAAAGSDPWEAQTGLALLSGLGIYRLARDPASTPGKTNAPNRDRVVVATSAGLFLGTRTRVPAAGGNPAHDEYRWTAVTAGLNTLLGTGNPPITDVVWLPGGANGRIVVAHAGAGVNQGVAISTTVGASFTAVAFASRPVANSRMSLARAGATNRVYVLAEHNPGAGVVPDVWQIPSVAAAAPAATATATVVGGATVGGLSTNLWPGQRDYDQAIAVDVVGGNDVIYVGGSVVAPTPSAEWSASLWALQTPQPPAAFAMTAAAGVARTGAPPGGDGADQAGLIGNNLHGDVHAIRVTGPAARRQVWVGCDGGIFRSDRSGRVNTFSPRHTGLAALEVGFHAPHPTSSHFGIIGSQDNGAQVRVGDTVWEETFVGDGGGVAFHPTLSQYVVAQWTSASWYAQPGRGFFGPLSRTQGGGMARVPGTPGPYDQEDQNSAFYSGPATIARTATQSRLAVGTDRVWLCDDVGVAAGSTWRVIGFPNGAGSDQAGSAAAPNFVGHPRRPAPGAVAAATGLGPVIRLRWVSPTVLLALYQRGIVQYTQTAANWATSFIIPGAANAPTYIAGNELFTDIHPVPATNDFYLTTTGNTATTATDTCFYYDSANNRFVATNLRRQFDPSPGTAGPLDPAFAVVVDPATPANVYVGTVTGVWRGVRGAGNAHVWTRHVNGLPEATVQDLTVWADPAAAAGSPRLLRAAVQSRGVWEVDLAAATEPQRTYVRVHERDDRRRLPTPMLNPRRRATAPAVRSHASPDITVRPRWPLATAPRWLLGGGSISNNAGRGYQLWTFQTAFRWIYPSVVADGRWSDQLADLIEFHRSVTPGLAVSRRLDRALWNSVVGGTRLTPTGQVSAVAPNPFAVYRAPWEHAGALTASATEIDLLETVVPQATRSSRTVWRVHREQVSVDVLIHHRDTRPLPANDAFAIVLWRSAASQASALSPDVSTFPAFAQSLLTVAPNATPAGWNLTTDAGGSGVHRLNETLDARLPKAVSVDVNLGAVSQWHRVLVVAIVGSNTDPITTAPSGAVTTPETLVRNWPHASMRLLQMVTRP